MSDGKIPYLENVLIACLPANGPSMTLSILLIGWRAIQTCTIVQTRWVLCFIDMDLPNVDFYSARYFAPGRGGLLCRMCRAAFFLHHRSQSAYSSTAPGEGTIRFFPDLTLLTAYIILKPLFKPIDNNPHKCVSLYLRRLGLPTHRPM